MAGAAALPGVTLTSGIDCYGSGYPRPSTLAMSRRSQDFGHGFRLSNYNGSVGLALQIPATRRRITVECTVARDAAAGASLYSILGLQQNVSQAEIKSAYRQMARRYHPDVCTESERQESIHKFIQVQEAYEILSDPEKRADYDYNLMHPFCAQALGRGFASKMSMTRRRHRWDEAQHQESTCGWKLQWEAQLGKLRTARQRFRASEDESWGERMRQRNLWMSEISADQ